MYLKYSLLCGFFLFLVLLSYSSWCFQKGKLFFSFFENNIPILNCFIVFYFHLCVDHIGVIFLLLRKK